jgi:predicted CxxxxCH...CXXCH cytochrome family protein
MLQWHKVTYPPWFSDTTIKAQNYIDILPWSHLLRWLLFLNPTVSYDNKNYEGKGFSHGLQATSFRFWIKPISVFLRERAWHLEKGRLLMADLCHSSGETGSALKRRSDWTTPLEATSCALVSNSSCITRQTHQLQSKHPAISCGHVLEKVV